MNEDELYDHITATHHRAGWLDRKFNNPNLTKLLGGFAPSYAAGYRACDEAIKAGTEKETP